MAARGLCMFTSKFCVGFAHDLFQPQVSSIGILACYQQSRGHKYYTKPRTKLPPWQVKVREPQVEENLTTESEEFLEKMAFEEYESPLKREPWPRKRWRPMRSRRVGLIGTKIGLVPQWKKDGTKINCTVIQVLDNHVIRYIENDKADSTWVTRPSGRKGGYNVVGANSTYPFEYTKEYCGLFREAGVPPKKKLFKFYVTPEAAVQPGTPLGVMHFRVGSYVDCVARSIDYGFQGAMRRHGFKGLRATHGVTKAHRKMGSTQSGRDHGLPKGKKMPGYMGNRYRYIRGVKIMRINLKYNLIYLLSTGIAGPNHSYVRMSDTILRNRRQEWKDNKWMLPMPTYFEEDTKEELPEEIFHEDLFQFTDNSIAFEVEETGQS